MRRRSTSEMESRKSEQDQDREHRAPLLEDERTSHDQDDIELAQELELVGRKATRSIVSPMGFVLAWHVVVVVVGIVALLWHRLHVLRRGACRVDRCRWCRWMYVPRSSDIVIFGTLLVSSHTVMTKQKDIAKTHPQKTCIKCQSISAREPATGLPMSNPSAPMKFSIPIFVPMPSICTATKPSSANVCPAALNDFCTNEPCGPA